MQLKGLIFDFDGLILDTERPKYQAWVEIYQMYHQELTIGAYAKCIGSSNLHFDPLNTLLKSADGKIDPIEVRKQQQVRELELLGKENVLLGVESLLKEAKDKGLLLAIASSSDRPWVIKHLTRLKLKHFFDTILTENDVMQVKPHPELFESALKNLEINAENAIAFEDSPNGMIAAKQAGLFVIGVPNPITFQLDLSHADIILPSLENIGIEQLINLVDQKRKTS
jgi:HAD superfamily hydrolase (TIGR01509 family)